MYIAFNDWLSKIICWFLSRRKVDPLDRVMAFQSYCNEEKRGSLHAVFRWCDLRGKTFKGVDFRYADFRGCDLSSTTFIDCNFLGVQAKGANIDGVQVCVSVQAIIPIDLSYQLFCENEMRWDVIEQDGGLMRLYGIPRIIPTEDIVGYKFARAETWKPVIVKLHIPATADTAIYEGMKCRASEAYVLDIYDLEGKKYSSAVSCLCYQSLTYNVGEWVFPDDWLDNPTIECGAGIHFFLTEAEAIEFMKKYT